MRGGIRTNGTAAEVEEGGSAGAEGRGCDVVDGDGGEVGDAIEQGVEGADVGGGEGAVIDDEVVETGVGRAPEGAAAELHVGGGGDEIYQALVVEKLGSGADSGGFACRRSKGLVALLGAINVEGDAVGCRGGEGDECPLADGDICRSINRRVIHIEPLRAVVEADVGIAVKVETLTDGGELAIGV